ncbi:hypothetical protein JG688_00012032 [Phytophthora aleatoria]|uniref:Uncharacterized protein n=1 Tax=Phytophthora aleatoria TaxID=2496075 RepID=A0A8J5IKY3_9STRA|nr:hypothetical protein JG688_00012032 [Phytophthora aleatoria]
MAALEAAAANGHANVLEALRPWPFNMGGPIDAAVADRRVQVGGGKERSLRDGRDVLPKPNSGGVSRALCYAAEYGRNDVVGLLLNNHEFSNDSILIALDEGARNDHCDVAKLLLGQFTDDETDDAAEGILAGGHTY